MLKLKVFLIIALFVFLTYMDLRFYYKMRFKLLHLVKYDQNRTITTSRNSASEIGNVRFDQSLKLTIFLSFKHIAPSLF